MLSTVIFLTLLLASICFFVSTLAMRLPPARWDLASLSHDNLGRRISAVLLEVFLQYKVIRDRPIVGILHALVMWGFFAFILVTIEHLWLGFTGLRHAPAASTFYRTFVAIWSLAVLVGIGGLSFRRFVSRPRALGAELSVTSGVVAALIATLMITYLLDWGALDPDTVAWRTNWWVHTISLLLMLAVIPRSKHLHLILAPFAIFFRPDTTSQMRALDLENDDFGMIHFQDLRLKRLLDLNACVECGRCTDRCPANATGRSLSPKDVILRMQQGFLARSTQPIAGATAEVLAGKAWVDETDLFQCLSCGACEHVCPTGIEHVGSTILDLRRGLVSEGRVSAERLVGLFTTMERSPHNPWGIPQETRTKLIASAGFPIFDGSQEYLFWLGCGNSYDPHGQAVAKAMAEIFTEFGVSWGVLDAETCCGEPTRRAGNEALFLDLSDRLLGVFRQRRVREIVTCCPHCTTMFDQDYRQLADFSELGIRVRHHSQFLAGAFHDSPVVPSQQDVAYHDPCYLARWNGVVDEPRELLRACGVTVKEPRHNRRDTSCCGAGGGQIFVADDSQDHGKERINGLRLEELSRAGTRRIAVACPYCHIMLQDAALQRREGEEALEIKDLAEIVADRLRAQATTGGVTEQTGRERSTP